MKMFDAKDLGLWRVTMDWGTVYEVYILGFSSYQGGALSGPYRYNGEQFGRGTFRFNEIAKLEKLS